MTYRDDEYDPPEQFHVYYCYDADGALLYVGVSREPDNRLSLHRYTSADWFHLCADVVVGDAMRRTEAYDLEAVEIATHEPPFNRYCPIWAYAWLEAPTALQDANA